MPKWIRQLFCSHIWFYHKSTWDYKEYKCIKCKKIKKQK